MGYLVREREVFETPENGVRYRFANPCDTRGGHKYAEMICQNCGRDFCASCCGNTNLHEGGKYDLDFVTCPGCGHDYFEVREDDDTIDARNIEEYLELIGFEE